MANINGLFPRNYPQCGRLVLYVVAIIIISVRTHGSNDCPHNGVRYEGRCYWVSESKSSWTDANAMCHVLYGDNVTLVTIKDEGTNSFVRNLTHAAVWLGLHEIHGPNNWRWVDNISPDNYSNWLSSRPTTDGPNANCAAMVKGTDRWKDVLCKKPYKFVCSEISYTHVCSKGGIYFRDRCYWPAPVALPWPEANEYCQENYDPDARIAVAKDPRTNRFLSRLIYPVVWLGLHDKNNEGDWRWVDNSPLNYKNWRWGEPNNIGKEDCATLVYQDGVWNDEQCGRVPIIDPEDGSGEPTISSDYDSELQPIINMNRFVCAVPNCYDPATGRDNTTDTNTVCLTEDCPVTCLRGSVCNGTDGECVCSKHFPEMTCDLKHFKIKMIPEAVKVTVGGTIRLRCQLNLPAKYVFDKTITWGPLLPAAKNRTTTTHHLHRGYSILEITNARHTDANVYSCRALMVPAALFPNKGEVATATVKVHANRTGSADNKQKNIDVNQSSNSHSLAVTLLSVTVSLLLLALVGLMLKLMLMERSKHRMSPLVELDERSSAQYRVQ